MSKHKNLWISGLYDNLNRRTRSTYQAPWPEPGPAP